MAKQPRVWTGTQWDTLAVTLPDLSNYSTTTQMNTAIDNAKGLVYITGSTFSAVSTVNINNCFSSTYQAYKINLTLNSPSADNFFRFRLRASGTDSTVAYYGMKIYITQTGATGSYADNGSSSLGLLTMDSATPSHSYFSTIDIMNPYQSAMTLGAVNSTGVSTASTVESYIGGFNHFLATSYDGFTLYPDAGTVSGTVRVYGYRNS